MPKPNVLQYLKAYSMMLGTFIIVYPSCHSERWNSGENIAISQLQSYVDRTSYYHLRAIEGIERGEEMQFVESLYLDSMFYYYNKIAVTFDSITSELMIGKVSQYQYDEIMNELFLDTLQNRMRRLSGLGWKVDLDESLK